MSKKESILNEFRQAACWFSDRWISLFIFGFAFSIRFTFRSAGLLHIDSVGYTSLGELTFKTMNLHYAHFPGHPGIVLINAGFYGLLQLFGFGSEFTTIFVSVLFGAMAAPLVYLICIRLGFSRVPALYAGIIMIFFPLQWSLSEYMPTDVESLFFLLAAFYFALKTGRKSVYFSSFLFMFSIAIKLENIFLLPFYIGMYLANLHQTYRDNFSKFIVTREMVLILLIQIIGLTLLYGPYIPSAKGVIDDPVRIASVQIKTLPLQLGEVFDLMITSFSFAGIILIILGIPGIFGMCLDRYSRRIVFMLLCLSIFSILFSASIPLSDYDRYILTGFSLLIIFAAFGLKRLGDLNKHIPVVVMAFLIIYMVYVTLPVVAARHAWAGQKEFATRLKALTGEDAIVVALDEGGLINYYTNLTTIQPNINAVESLLNQNRSVYVLGRVMAYYHGNEFAEEGEKRFNFKLVGVFPSEDWHGTVLNRLVFMEHVYRIEYKRD
ncbi:MAG: phospholipid carrier-dependent glycosyltransferase [Candidatus Methanoperedens sp.]|nr:phospholipid carrier-dependent glycosyltransferase [Candidatus Methanoperedens sp.]